MGTIRPTGGISRGDDPGSKYVRFDAAEADAVERLELWGCGLVDEWEVSTPEHDLQIYGPFASEEAARAHARTLSSDPEEADVFRLRPA
jgi:hypothetical protein